MSTDCCYVRIRSVDGATVVLEVLSGFGGGLDDLFTSRSFALSVLLDAVARLDDVDHQTTGAPQEDADRMRALVAKARRLAPSSALHRAVHDPEPWGEGWHREHVPRFIRRTRLLARHNDIGGGALSAILEEISAVPPVWPFMRAAWARLHTFELEVEVTDPKYLGHLVVGVEFGTTAYDAWREPTPGDTPPPERSPRPEAEVAPRRPFDALVERLVAAGLVELKAGKGRLVAEQLSRVDADDELSLCHEIVRVLLASKGVEELYASDEQLFAEIRAVLASEDG